jgi:hypothetical protein
MGKNIVNISSIKLFRDEEHWGNIGTSEVFLDCGLVSGDVISDGSLCY